MPCGWRRRIGRAAAAGAIGLSVLVVASGQAQSQVSVAQRAVETCEPPLTYSQGLRRCVCLREGFAVVRGHCVRVDGESAQMRPAVRIPSEVTDRLAQDCLREAGYLDAPSRRVMSDEAWTAFWHFKHDHRVGRTPDGIHNPHAKERMFALCPRTVAEAEPDAAEPEREPEAEPEIARMPVPETAPEAEPESAGAPEAVRPAAIAPVLPDTTADEATADDERSAVAALPQIPASLTPTPSPPAMEPVPVLPESEMPASACLPDDLLDLVRTTYGPRPLLASCGPSCVAPPPHLSPGEMEELETRSGVAWCDGCLEITAVMPLHDVLSIERGANVDLCVRPASRLPRWTHPHLRERRPYTAARALFRSFARGTDHGNDIAVVIGNRAYGGGLPRNRTAHNNAGAIYALLTEHLGYRYDNLIDMRDATRDDFHRVFGDPEGDGSSELAQRMRANPDARVLIYYAGHGLSNADRSESYLLPVDAQAHREERTGYPVSALYEALPKLGARSVLVLIEAGFGRDADDFVFAPNAAEMPVRNLPRVPLPGITVLTAADGDQKPLDDPQYAIGLFTRYVLEGMAGQADQPPLGNGDNRVEAVELYAYTAHMVRLAARKSYGLLQYPQMSWAGNGVVSRLQARLR